MFLPFKSLHLYYSLLVSLLKVSLSLSPTLSFVLTAFPSFFFQCESHWVHIYNLAFHFMASGNGCFTAFIKACSSQHRVFPLKFSSMNLAIRGHYGPRFQGTVEHCIIWLVLLIKWNTAPFTPISLPSSSFLPFQSCFQTFQTFLPSSSPYPCTSPSRALQHMQWKWQRALRLPF